MTTNGFTIDRHVIGAGAPVFFIAEAGVNHNSDLELGRQLVRAAKAAGADAVKFQTFRAERLNTRAAPKSTYHVETTGPDAKQTWFELLKTQELSREAHEALLACCREEGIVFLSTPYDEESADLLESLDVAAFKIASTDTNNLPLLRHIARKGRPMILSTAMCTLDEARDAVETVRGEGLRELVVMHCTGNYPARLADTNMRALTTFARELGVLTGYSDHTLESVNAAIAVALGASVYEKHFTLDRALPGPDHRMSLTVPELTATIRLLREAELALGSPVKAVLESERENRLKLRKSLVAARDLPAGRVLERDDIAVKRPGTGMPPAALDGLLGRRLKAALAADEQFEPVMIE